MNIVFGTVAYQNPEDINSWLAHVNRQTQKRIEAAVCDNSPDAASAKKISDICDRYEALYIQQPHNPGYFSGLNRVIGQTHGDVYVLSNPDIIFADDFATILESIRTDQSVAVLAPAIVDVGGDNKNPYIARKPNNFEYLLNRIKYSNFLFYALVSIITYSGLYGVLSRTLGNQPKEDDRREKYIWSAHGSCFVLTEAYVKHLNKLPEETFLWFEEVILSEYIQHKGFRLQYVPELKAQHLSHSTISSLTYLQRYEIKREAFKKYRTYKNNLRLGNPALNGDV